MALTLTLTTYDLVHVLVLLALLPYSVNTDVAIRSTVMTYIVSEICKVW